MSLQQKLDQMKQEFVAGADPEILKTMQESTAKLISSGILDRTLKAGSRAPDFTLQDAGGKTFESSTLLKKGPLLITFYRGVW